MKQFLLCVGILIASPTFATDIIKISVGKDHQRYSKKELRQRVWQLEQAVLQLQQKIFQIQNNHVNSKPVAKWACTVHAMNDTFTATGASQAVTKAKAIKKCTKKRGNNFFCKEAKCEN